MEEKLYGKKEKSTEWKWKAHKWKLKSFFFSISVSFSEGFFAIKHTLIIKWNSLPLKPNFTIVQNGKLFYLFLPTRICRGESEKSLLGKIFNPTEKMFASSQNSNFEVEIRCQEILVFHAINQLNLKMQIKSHVNFRVRRCWKIFCCICAVVWYCETWWWQT